MIIQNGYIEALTVTGDYDPHTGYPVDGTETYSEKIPCQFFLKASRQFVLAEGERKETESYQVLVEEQQGVFKPEQVRLSDMNGIAIGVFVVETVEPLEAVSEIRLTIKLR